MNPTQSPALYVFNTWNDTRMVIENCHVLHVRALQEQLVEVRRHITHLEIDALNHAI